MPADLSQTHDPGVLSLDFRGHGASGGCATLGRDGVLDAVVAVSGPSSWNYRGTRPMRVVHALVNTRAGRWGLAARRGTQVCGADWHPPPDAVAGPAGGAESARIRT